MSTLEKLFAQIFERRDRILDELQQQADSYTQQLASKLLIDGITPPPWLLSPSSNSNPPDPNGLENEKIISKLLLRPTRDSTRYSTGGGSLYYQPVVGGADINKQLFTATCMEGHAPNSTVSLRSETVVAHEFHNNDTVGSLGHVEVVDSGGSPQNEMDARITSIHEAPDMSLARIQRSKSRQKARELRTSGKTTGKSCSGNEKRACVSFSGDLKCKKDFNQVFQQVSPPDAGKLNIVIGATSMEEDGNGAKGVDSTSHSGRLAKFNSSCEIPSLENEHNQIGSSSDKEELGGCIMEEPACDSLQQSCHVDGVMEGVNLSDASLESYVGQKSISGKTQGTESQNNFISGRITRSKSSNQQNSGINKSSKLGTSASYNPRGGGALSHSVGDLMHEVSITNKLSDAVETSEVVGDINEETQAICSNKGALKPVLHSHMDTKESSFGANHQENTEIVVAKQLNFDETDKCDLNEISSSLSKKRKLDGSLIDHKASYSFFEQQLLKKNALSRSPKSTRTHIGLETNKNPVVEAEPNSKFSLNDDTNLTSELVLSPIRFDNEFDEETRSEKSPLEDHASPLEVQTKEDGLSNKGKESAWIDDCLDKAVNKLEVGLDSSKSKEFEVGTNAMLSNMELNYTKGYTWPLNQQKHVEDHPNCFSDSRNFRARIQRDAIHCDLDAPEKDEMISVFPAGTEPLPEIQAAEEIVTRVNDDISELTDTLKQSVSTSVLNGDAAFTDSNNFEINLPDWVSSYGSVRSSQHDDKTIFVSDEITPVYEGFIIDEDIGNVDMENNEGGIDLDTLEVPTTTIERASFIEQICKSASMQTPLSQYYQYMEDSRKHLQTIDSGITGIDSTFSQQKKLDYATPFSWESKNLYSSPVGKLWERSASSSRSSDMQLGSNPDLTCFPIEEDPGSNEESDELQENINPTRVSTETKIEKREKDDDVAVEIQEPPVESTEVCGQHGNHVSMASMKYPDRYSSASVNIEVSVPMTRERVKHKPKVQRGIKVSKYEESRGSSIVTRASSRGNVSVSSKNKSSMRSRIPMLSQKEAKRNNIVSNVTSFIPMVQQKQAAAICTGKRDIKVKALEAAEAAKRREEERENERKQKKEALKLERARIEKENAKEIALKKKEAEMARKRHREEEEERKQLAKKRKPAAEAQKNQKLKIEKSKHAKNAAVVGNKKNSANPGQHKNANNVPKENESRVDKTLASAVPHIASVPENNDASNDCSEIDKATRIRESSPVKVVPVNLTSQENSYEISPYQCSDDEDDEDDDRPTKKFVPSWASKNRVAVVLPLQQDVNPESIFPVDSFCSMDKVLLPRRLQAL